MRPDQYATYTAVCNTIQFDLRTPRTAPLPTISMACDTVVSDPATGIIRLAWFRVDLLRVPDAQTDIAPTPPRDALAVSHSLRQCSRDDTEHLLLCFTAF